MRRSIAALAVLTFALTLTGCGGGGESAPATHTITGIIRLGVKHMGAGSMATNDFCAGTGGYSDLRTGLAVAVFNNTGDQIALGKVDKADINPEALACDFSFTIANVPDSDMYSFKFGHRGAPAYSKADLEAANWTLTLSIGMDD